VASAATFSLSTANAPEINAAFEAGALNSETLTGLYLARIAAHEPTLHAVIRMNPKRSAKIGEEAPSGSAERPSPTHFANLYGFPDLIVPAGFTSSGLPVEISFFGPAFSEPRLLALGYSYEQSTKNLRVPIHAKPLPGETITYRPPED
jgi:amidase